MKKAKAPAEPVIVRVPLDSLKLDPKNPRIHGEKNLKAIADSLSRFGQVEPILVEKKSRKIIGGHGRVVALREQGATECLVVELDVAGKESRALALALNRTGDLAEYDNALLLEALEGLEVPGFDEDDLDDLLAEPERGDVDDPGPQEPPEKPITKAGDLWLLGDHRLLCGDSTKADDVARVMNGELAGLMATDPPYLVDYQGGTHPPKISNRLGGRNKDKVWTDYKEHDIESAIYSEFVAVAIQHLIKRAPIYQWHASKCVETVLQAWKANGLLAHQTIVWVKSRAVLTYSHFRWKFEPCLYGWIEGDQPERDRRPPVDFDNVWIIDQAGENDGIHPTQKPRQIFANPMRWHLRQGEIAYEPFCGSGTSIIAAEETGRRCFALEMSPAFCDAIVARWEKSTGRKAHLEK